MVLYVLYAKAELDGISALSLKTAQTKLCLDVRNPASDYECREKIVIDPSQYVEQEEHSREPPFHFGIKWEGTKKQSVVTVLMDEAVIKSAVKKSSGKKKGGKKNDLIIPRSLTVEDNGSFVPIAMFDCRGVEPYKFHPSSGGGDVEFVVESEGGTLFEEDIDLSEGDWADYDEENDIAVTVSEFETKIEAL